MTTDLKIDLSQLLVSAQPVKKIAQIRRLYPQICVAKENGLTRKEIWQIIQNGGVDISYASFISYLLRIESSGEKPDSLKQPVSTVSQPMLATDEKNQSEVNHVPPKSVYSALEKVISEEIDYSQVMKKKLRDERK